MYVMTIDQRGSRERTDGVPEVLELLGRVETRLGFERTIGDEVQGVLDSPEQVTLAVRLLAAQAEWHIGIGIGSVENPLPTSTAEGRGEAFYAARRAVEAAKNAPANLVVDPSANHASLAESALRLLIWTFENIRPQSRRYIDRRLDHPDATQNDIAAHFDVSQQAVSRVLSPGGVELIEGACALSTFHLNQVEAGLGSHGLGDGAKDNSQAGDHVV
ncbi:MAG: MarR family transcriptional regulator [Brevibacterium aurantiacum]